MGFSKSIVLITVAITFSASIGCSRTPTMQMNGPAKYYSFSGGKKVGDEYQIEVDSNVYKALQIWLNKERAWKRDWNSYAPQKVLESELVKINYLGNTVVVSTRKNESDTWKQFSCTSDSDLEKIFEEME